jgi:uncharacterized protein YjiS (DUF1127 family)
LNRLKTFVSLINSHLQQLSRPGRSGPFQRGHREQRCGAGDASLKPEIFEWLMEDAMSAITAYAFWGSAFVVRAMNAAGAFAVRIFRAARNRHSARMLARLDDRQLADIGLTRSDLRDAYAEPLWDDPTSVLACRAAERRLSRKRAAFENSVDHEEGQRPSANRPACYLS